ncbi:MAG: glycosyltransferase family 4 protein [Ignavibacteria bacterium]|nr:glycosyltransferase family 4 protein [Ignavibacteria bacterium]
MKKVLIISYYFPPMGMGGVQRTAKFAKYLGKFGWQPYVLTVTPKMYLASDNCLLHEMLSSGVKIFRTGSGEVNGESGKVVKFKKDSNRKLLSNISQTFLLPDSKIFWKSPALTLAEKIVKEEGIEMIFATAPPYTDFLIACELKEKTGLPVVVDYRDSWIDCPNNFYPTPLHKNIHRKMETHVLEHADKVVTINDRIKELIHLRYPFVKDEKVMVIPQGFDPDDFDQSKHASKNGTPGKMRITYSGSFLNYYTPKYFLDGLKAAIDRVPEMRSNVEACFVGTFPEEYREYIRGLGIEECVNITGYVEHSVCTSYLRDSHVLWMMINKSERSDLHSTGKLYEYLGAGKPILACVPEGVARKSLEGHGASILTEPDDTAAITNALISLYENFKKGTLPIPSIEMTSIYDRKKLTGKLAEEFTRLAEVHSQETIKV